MPNEEEGDTPVFPQLDGPKHAITAEEWELQELENARREWVWQAHELSAIAARSK